MQRHGIILLDDHEVIFRIYETTDHSWKLHHYHSALLPSSSFIDAADILEIIGDFFATNYAQHIAEWKICSRHLPKELIQDVTTALAVSIEDIGMHREQELICKGMFTEVW